MDNDYGLQPYQLEPRRARRDGEGIEEDGDDVVLDKEQQFQDNEWRKQSKEWCECRRCELMATADECLCCREIGNASAKMNIGLEDEMKCIVEHFDFEFVCLHTEVLRTTLIARSDIRRNEFFEPIENETFRLAAYRQFTYWVHDRLGKAVRRVIPACVVQRIRQEFPSNEQFLCANRNTLVTAMHKQTTNSAERPSTTRQVKKRKSEFDSKESSKLSRDSKLGAYEGDKSKYFSTKSEDGKRLGRDFFSKPCVTLAKDLLGQSLVRVLDSGERLSGMIVETEAYCGKDDTACHSYKGRRSEKNNGMFMEPGTTYVYLIYGMYYCLNISSEGEGTVVLIRALEPIEGSSKMQVHRQRRRKETSTPLKAHQLCSGPGKLTDALHITKSLDQIDLVTCPYMWLEKGDTIVDKGEIISCPRIGIDSVEETWRLKPLRFYICGNKCVSVRNKKAENEIEGI